jgi:hypothetical protein
MSSDLQNKMEQWEVKPPAEAWDKIAASLDSDEEYVLSQKLSSFESQPPQHAWANIEAALAEDQPVRVVSFYQKHKHVFQYSGAAAALIIAVLLISLMVSRSSGSNELAQQSSVQSVPQIRETPSSADHQNIRTSMSAFADSQHTSTSSETVTEAPSHTTANHPEPNSHKAGKISGSSDAIADWKPAMGSLENRYFVHTNNKGEAVRFSSKLYDLFECSEEWTATECAQQIRLWQQKAATSSLYASADFTGVLEMLKGMQGMTNNSNDE